MPPKSRAPLVFTPRSRGPAASSFVSESPFGESSFGETFADSSPEELADDSLDLLGASGEELLFEEVLLNLQEAHDNEVTSLRVEVAALRLEKAEPRRLRQAHDAQVAALRCEIVALRQENTELRLDFAAEFGPLQEPDSIHTARLADAAQQLAESAAQAAVAAEAANTAAAEVESMRGLLIAAEMELERLRSLGAGMHTAAPAFLSGTSADSIDAAAPYNDGAFFGEGEFVPVPETSYDALGDVHGEGEAQDDGGVPAEDVQLEFAEVPEPADADQGEVGEHMAELVPDSAGGIADPDACGELENQQSDAADGEPGQDVVGDEVPEDAGDAVDQHESLPEAAANDQGELPDDAAPPAKRRRIEAMPLDAAPDDMEVYEVEGADTVEATVEASFPEAGSVEEVPEALGVAAHAEEEGPVPEEGELVEEAAVEEAAAVPCAVEDEAAGDVAEGAEEAEMAEVVEAVEAEEAAVVPEEPTAEEAAEEAGVEDGLAQESVEVEALVADEAEAAEAVAEEPEAGIAAAGEEDEGLFFEDAGAAEVAEDAPMAEALDASAALEVAEEGMEDAGEGAAAVEEESAGAALEPIDLVEEVQEAGELAPPAAEADGVAQELEGMAGAAEVAEEAVPASEDAMPASEDIELAPLEAEGPEVVVLDGNEASEVAELSGEPEAEASTPATARRPRELERKDSGLMAKCIARPPQQHFGEDPDQIDLSLSPLPEATMDPPIPAAFAKGMPSQFRQVHHTLPSLEVPEEAPDSPAEVPMAYSPFAKSMAKSMPKAMAKYMVRPPDILEPQEVEQLQEPQAQDALELEDSMLGMDSFLGPRFDDLILQLQRAHMLEVEVLRNKLDMFSQGMGNYNGSSNTPRASSYDAVNFPPSELDFTSTVDSWNRERDRARVEGELRLREQGDPNTVFVDPKDPTVIIGRGYRRVLYGDHGPYVEFSKDQVRWEAFPVVWRKGPRSYYHEHYTATKFVKAYEQRKTVGDKPNPPPGRWTVRNNRYKTGYADYQPGVVYMAADAVQVSRWTTPCREEAGLQNIDELFPHQKLLRQENPLPPMPLRADSFDSMYDSLRANSFDSMASPGLEAEEVPECVSDTDFQATDAMVAISPSPPRVEETVEDVERKMREHADSFFTGRDLKNASREEAAREAVQALLTGFAEGLQPDLPGQIQQLRWTARYQLRLAGSSYKAFVESRPEELVLMPCPRPSRFLVLPTPEASLDKIGKDFWAGAIAWCRERRLETEDAAIQREWSVVEESVWGLACQAGHVLDDFMGPPSVEELSPAAEAANEPAQEAAESPPRGLAEAQPKRVAQPKRKALGEEPAPTLAWAPPELAAGASTDTVALAPEQELQHGLNGGSAEEPPAADAAAAASQPLSKRPRLSGGRAPADTEAASPPVPAEARPAAEAAAAASSTRDEPSPKRLRPGAAFAAVLESRAPLVEAPPEVLVEAVAEVPVEAPAAGEAAAPAELLAQSAAAAEPVRAEALAEVLPEAAAPAELLAQDAAAAEPALEVIVEAEGAATVAAQAAAAAVAPEAGAPETAAPPAAQEEPALPETKARAPLEAIDPASRAVPPAPPPPVEEEAEKAQAAWPAPAVAPRLPRRAPPAPPPPPEEEEEAEVEPVQAGPPLAEWEATAGGPAMEVPALEVPALEVPAPEVPAAEELTPEVPAPEVPAGAVPAAEELTVGVPAQEVPAAAVPAAEEVTVGDAAEPPAEELPTAEVPLAGPALVVPEAGISVTATVVEFSMTSVTVKALHVPAEEAPSLGSVALGLAEAFARTGLEAEAEAAEPSGAAPAGTQAAASAGPSDPAAAGDAAAAAASAPAAVVSSSTPEEFDVALAPTNDGEDGQ